jgi:chromate transporter
MGLIIRAAYSLRCNSNTKLPLRENEMMETPTEKQEAAHNAPTLAGLFLLFLRLGATAFGGPAMVAHISEVVVKRKKWMDPPTFKGGVVLAQSIPGATMMQVVAYVGLHVRGTAGAILSYIAFGLPAFLLMLAFSAVYAAYGSVPRVTSVFSGLQVIVVAIIANATYTFGRSSLKHYMHILLAAAAALAFWLGVSPFYVILGAALAGILLLKEKPETQPAKAQKERISAVPVLSLIAILALCLLFLYFIRPDLFSLVLLMMKVDLFAFGGGFASLPLMLQEVVHVKGWMDARTFMDGIALGQVTPGPIVITAAFVGYLSHRLLGSIIATVAIFAPSFILLILTAPFFNRLKGSPPFLNATHGVLASFVGLLLYVTISFAIAVPWDLFRVILVLAVLAALIKKVDLIYIVLIGAGLSFFLF